MIAGHDHRPSRLEGAPTTPGDFVVANWQLRSRLQGAPTSLGDFVVANRQLRSRLEGAPTPPGDFLVATRQLQSRLDTEVEVEYYRAGGVLTYVLDRIAGEA